MAAATDQTYYVGQGSVLIAPRITAGAINGGYINVGDTAGLTVSMKQQMVKIQENQTGFGFTALSRPVSLDASVKLILTQWSQSNLARALQSLPAVANMGGTVTGETQTAYNGSSFYLANMDVTLLTLKAGTTALVEGTDYTVNGSFGRVDILPGSTVVPAGAGVVLTSGYTYAANNGSVGMATQTIAEASVRVEAWNVANPFTDSNNSSFQAIGFNLHRVQFDIAKVLDLIGKKDATLELDGELLMDQSKPYVPGTAGSVFFDVVKR
jgi:hypothetical protein